MKLNELIGALLYLQLAGSAAAALGTVLWVSLPTLPAGYERGHVADVIALFLVVLGLLAILASAIVLGGVTAGQLLAQVSP